MSLPKEIIDKLVKEAINARTKAYIPYSTYAVGAALLTHDGTIITGANIKGGSFSLVCCAERIALLKALFDGHRMFTALAVATEDGATPCGSCRQIIHELCNNMPIIITKTDQTYTILTINELFPHPFEDAKTKCRRTC
jgi:cytidine deaminase